MLAAVVERAVERAVESMVRQLRQPEPLVYTVHQAAHALQVSPDTVGRMIRRGTLLKVPHLDGRVLIPRVAVEALIHETSAPKFS